MAEVMFRCELANSCINTKCECFPVHTHSSCLPINFWCDIFQRNIRCASVDSVIDKFEISEKLFEIN